MSGKVLKISSTRQEEDEYFSDHNDSDEDPNDEAIDVDKSE